MVLVCDCLNWDALETEPDMNIQVHEISKGGVSKEDWETESVY